MSITRSDEGAEKEISEMGVGLRPREGSDEGQMRDRMGGIGLRESNGGSDMEGQMRGRTKGGRTRGIRLEGSDWRDWTRDWTRGGRTRGVRLGPSMFKSK